MLLALVRLFLRILRLVRYGARGRIRVRDSGNYGRAWLAGFCLGTIDKLVGFRARRA